MASSKRYLSEYRNFNFDSDEAAEISYQVLREKKCLRDIYAETYMKMMWAKNKFLRPGEDILEIGSGGGFIKDLFPKIITSDVKKTHSDMVLNAENIPFEAGSLDAIFAMHAIHHIQNINNFFKEALRVLRPGGGVVCVEPYYSPLAKIIYKKMHPEPFDEAAQDWELDSNHKSGPMTGSNQALSYIVFKRDYAQFKERYPDFDFVYDYPFGFVRYMATGGLWLKPKVGIHAFPFLKGLEVLLRPIMPLVALHHIFVVKKK